MMPFTYIIWTLQATIWSSLTKIVKNVGSEAAKNILDTFLPELIVCAEGPHKQSAHFAEQCLHTLMNQVW